MPIRHYLGAGVVFTPQALSAMSKALEETTTILGVVGDERREMVARFIIRLAGEDDSLDATALRERALAALGGVAYSAASAQPVDSHAAH
jgi:hypothetical protein